MNKIDISKICATPKRSFYYIDVGGLSAGEAQQALEYVKKKRKRATEGTR